MLALLFPGQASQAVGMGSDLRAGFGAARDLYALADQVTGLLVSGMCADGPLERLTETDIAQPAVVTTSLAALAVLRSELPGLGFGAVAGHSVGEFAACVAAGALTAAQALELVHVRAQAMAAACRTVDGTMAAVIGLDEEPLRQACAAASTEGSSVELANLNAPGQLIISGARDAIDRCAVLAKAAGARRVLPLNVGGPFHSVYMRPAAGALVAALANVDVQPAAVPVALNASASVSAAPDDLRHELEVQVYSPVRWTASLQALARMGCDRFLEVGPGNVLQGMVKRTLPDARVASFGCLQDLDSARALVQ